MESEIYFDAIYACDSLYDVRRHVFEKFFPSVFKNFNRAERIVDDYDLDFTNSWRHLTLKEKIRSEINRDDSLISAALSNL